MSTGKMAGAVRGPVPAAREGLSAALKATERGGEVEITGVGEFDLRKTFECGQCFRWNPEPDGAYVGVAFGKAARIRRSGGSVFITGTLGEFNEVWRGYFDLDRDYGAIRRALCVDGYMERAARFGAGIRILRQEAWEVLCTFILSQCNNIPRIKSIVERLCRLCGEPVEFSGSTLFAFPSAEKVAGLAEADLSPLRCGYRAPYVLEAARAVAEGRLDLNALASYPAEEAVKALKRLPGVGEKVARCVALYGLHMLDAFPVDTWVRRAIEEGYGGHVDPAAFGEYAGIAQQYIFHYARNGRGGKGGRAPCPPAAGDCSCGST